MHAMRSAQATLHVQLSMYEKNLLPWIVTQNFQVEFFPCINNNCTHTTTHMKCQ